MEQLSIEQLKSNPDNVKYISIGEMIKSDNNVRQQIEHEIDNGIIPDPDECIDSFGEFVDPTINRYIHCDNPSCKWNSFIPQPSYGTVQKIYEYTVVSDNDIDESHTYTLCDECHVTNACKMCVKCWKLYKTQYTYDTSDGNVCIECMTDDSDNKTTLIEKCSVRTEINCIDLDELLEENEANAGMFYTDVDID